jgi:hypothetical protein
MDFGSTRVPVRDKAEPRSPGQKSSRGGVDRQGLAIGEGAAAGWVTVEAELDRLEPAIGSKRDLDF